jgi:putative phosphoribosyl transferase
MGRPTERKGEERLVRVAAGSVTLEGNLSLLEGAREIVLFAHSSGSSRHSPRNRYVAQALNEARLATLLVDLLTPDEEAIDLRTAHLRFDIDQRWRAFRGAHHRGDRRHRGQASKVEW